MKTLLLVVSILFSSQVIAHENFSRHEHQSAVVSSSTAIASNKQDIVNAHVIQNNSVSDLLIFSVLCLSFIGLVYLTFRRQPSKNS